MVLCLFCVSVDFTYIIPHFLHFTTALKFEEEELKLGKDGKRREKTWGWFLGHAPVDVSI
jgi:hypothetical protein